ncbi:hypothetical protein A0H81_10221 [Grifola frondosa]|uniref:Uncharacterized protein n=1 Tax=Grifola frondosa TaxID=5627 RepID=A0A1C7LY23_GRIFR|nr:hypothetical protein A0H81_10221 [Grifola frondosa]
MRHRTQAQIAVTRASTFADRSCLGAYRLGDAHELLYAHPPHDRAQELGRAAGQEMPEMDESVSQGC